MCSVGRNFALALMVVLCPLVTTAQLTAFKSQFNQVTYEKAIQLLKNNAYSLSTSDIVYALEDVNQILKELEA